MVASAILAFIVLGHSKSTQAVNGASMWEGTCRCRRCGGYHPILRFGCWQIIRFNISSTYMFLTPDMVQQGQFDAQDGQYNFRAVMANELENADIAKLLGGMDESAGDALHKAYARSLSNFGGSYNDGTKVLTVSYPINGRLKSFQLHATTEGDDQRTFSVSDAARGMIGLWHAPEPFPEKLDARTRYKIGDLEGLQRFAREAGTSNGAEFDVLDLRSDGTFRAHATLGSWSRQGSTLTLFADGKRREFAISTTGAKLLEQGKAAYVRN